MKSLILTEYRCKCGKLLFKGLVLKEVVEIKCPRCGLLNYFKGIGILGDHPNRFVILTDSNGKILNASISIESILGLKTTALLGKNIDKVFADKSRVEADKILSAKIVGKKYLRLDSACKNIRDKKLPVSVCYRHINNNGQSLVLRIFDIVPPVEKRLVKQADFDEDCFGGFICETDEDGILVYVDENVKKIFGFKPEETVGRNVYEFIAEKDKEQRLKNYEMLRAKKKAYRVMSGFKIIGRDKKPIELDAYCSPFYDDLGNFIGFRNILWVKR